MTRGTLVVIKDSKFHYSTEFNGGFADKDTIEEVKDGFEKIHTVDDFEKFVEKFNETHYQYPEKLVYGPGRNGLYGYGPEKNGLCGSYTFKEMFDMDDYFWKWFSDYVWFKNLDNIPYEFTLRNGLKVVLKEGCIGILDFGNLSDIPNEFEIDLESSIEWLLDGSEWYVNQFEGDKDGKYYVLLYPDSWITEDFPIEMVIKDVNDFFEEIQSAYECFDPDEHAERWVEARYNSKVSGIPDIRRLIDEADEEQRLLEELWFHICKKRR